MSIHKHFLELRVNAIRNNLNYCGLIDQLAIILISVNVILVYVLSIIYDAQNWPMFLMDMQWVSRP